MKKLVLLFSMFAAVAVTSCSKDEGFITPSTEREPITIGLSTVGISYSDLPSSRTTESGDLLAVQIYEVNGDIATPYANGLFDDWSALSFEGYSNTTYEVVATMVVDGENQLYVAAGVYGKPFDAAVASAFEYSASAMVGLTSGAATLADGAEYAVPNIDRYFGIAEAAVTAENPTITTTLKRVAFGIAAEGIDGEITIAVAGAPEVALSAGDMEIYSLENLEVAYSAAETTANYSETKSVEIIKNGASVKTTSVEFFRNKLATITIDTTTGELGFDFEVPFEDDMADAFTILTFEDADYKAGENYIGGSSWSSLIDPDEGNGDLIYSSTTQYTWTDTNNTFLNGVVNEGADWTTYEPDWKFWTGGIVVSNYYCEVVAGTEVSYERQLSVSNGSAGAAGHNGSANFAVVYDGAAGGMGTPVFLSFGDSTARTIDHLYISGTSYLESVAIDGNSLSPALGADDTYTVTAIGLDANGDETGRVSYEFVQEGAFVRGWNKWDLSSIGDVVKVKFSLSSSVSNDYGMSLPAYFAFDDVAVVM